MKFFIILILLKSSFCLSQVKSIEYNAIPTDTSLSKIPDQFKNEFFKNNKNITKVTFTLQFNENEMKFFANKNSELSKDDFDMSLSMAHMDGTTYRKRISNEVFNEFEIFKNLEEYIASSKYIFDWNITNDTKMINGLKCFKATSTLNIDYGDGEINKLYPITAWFCPEINYSFGPRGIGGLPGIILELNQNIITFYATKIDLEEKQINISIPSDKKIISTAEMYDLK